MTQIKLDKKDKKILEVLYKNGRALIKDISKKTGIPRDSVNYRIKKMEKQGVIRFFNPILDPAKMGFPIFTFINMSLKSYSAEQEKKFIGFVDAHPNIIYGAKLTGKYHYLLAIAAKDLQQLDSVMKEILDKFSDLIREYDASSILDEFKYDAYANLIN